jgi:hypothetical protein
LVGSTATELSADVPSCSSGCCGASSERSSSSMIIVCVSCLVNRQSCVYDVAPSQSAPSTASHLTSAWRVMHTAARMPVSCRCVSWRLGRVLGERRVSDWECAQSGVTCRVPRRLSTHRKRRREVGPATRTSLHHSHHSHTLTSNAARLSHYRRHRTSSLPAVDSPH